MINDISVVKIGQVWNQGRGETFKDMIDANPLLSQINLMSPVKADLMMIRMKDGVAVVLDNLHTTVEIECARCLTKYQQSVSAAQTEIHFLSSKTVEQPDDTDYYPINLKDLSIDLTEAIRQEIILHFPLIPVCSKSCKGLCPNCRANLNTGEHQNNCNYKEEKADSSNDQEGSHPFANLKDLFKD